MKKGTKGIRRVFTGLNEYFVFDLDEDAFGKRKRLYAKSEPELKAKIEAAQAERKASVSCYKPKTSALSEYVLYYFRNAVGNIPARDIKRLLTLFERAVFKSEIDRNVSDLTEQNLQDFYNLLIEKFPRKSVEEIHTILKRTFDITNDEGLTDISLEQLVVPEEKARVAVDYILEPVEFKSLLNFCLADNCTRYGKNEQLIIMSMFTGLKFSSIKQLLAKDIDLDLKAMYIENRTFPLTNDCVNWLTAQTESGSLPELFSDERNGNSYDENAIVFVNSNSVSPTLQSIQSTLSSVTICNGLPKGITGKTLCKSYVVSEMANGADLDELCSRLQYKNKLTLSGILDEYEVRKALF